MNRNYMFYGFIAVVALAIVGAAFLFFVQSPGADKFVTYIFNILTMLGTIATLLWGLNKTHNQQDKMDSEILEVKKQTNGNLSSRDETIQKQNAEIVELRIKAAIAEKELELISKGAHSDVNSGNE